MSNDLYAEMMNNSNNPLQMLNKLRSNPIQFVLNKGFSIPQNIDNNPNSIIQYLLNSGQVSQQSYNKAVQMAQSLNQYR